LSSKISTTVREGKELLQDLESTPQNFSQSIVLENADLQLMVRPDLGGRIDQVYDKTTKRNWLWHSPGYDASKTRALSVGASFDENWTGGWDEIFPNDVEGDFQGYQLADHGELWSQSWEVKEHSSLTLRLGLICQTVPVRVEKTIQLHATKPEFTLTYRFENLSVEEIPFLFKHHAAIAIEAGDDILLPDCLIEPVVLDFSRIIGREGKTRFPHAFGADGQEVDLRQTPARSSQLQEFYYSSELATGECGIYNPRSRSAFKMLFDRADFPYVWVFQSYGGWRNHYVLILEPSTTMPYDLEIACQNGTVAQLKPHETQSRTLTVRLEHH
jgi:galactose mutarotase-like enzyme